MRLELPRTRQRGYAIDREEIIAAVHCIAVPILDHAGQPVGAIGVAGTTPRTDGGRLDALVLSIENAGEYVSRRLGFIARVDVPALPGNGRTPVDGHLQASRARADA